ncbi:MAG: hypothetical protein ACF8TS_20665 [Maioricimonas sp. JB049]
MLQFEKLTGWATYPIVLYDREGNEYCDYAGLSVTGRCGPLLEKRSESISEGLPGSAFPRLLGMYFDESTWDGSDFFCPAGTNAFILVTERAKAVLESGDLKECRFAPLNEVEWYG